ncbi:outer membrane protein [Martelella mediterranea]|uniref:Outer membrane immunogenic protein n=1 Tax=Martelella mediterranea TaxID=293089 RepID=A0A4R3NP05_9HYPH|nr:outer membrane protein [Martelella mediterranea]TCT37137.1 outer membrane immunogenic protein [Martelella mediterranea]
MRNLKKTLAFSAAAIMGASTVQAADAIVGGAQPYEPSPATYAAPAPVNNWSGFHVGGALNWDWGTFDGGDFKADGWGGTLYGGYDMQQGNIVYGVEADLSTSNQSQHVNPGIKMEQGVNGSLRGRVGYAFDPILVYGTGGLAGSRLVAKQGGMDDTQMAWGYTVGAGAEAMITNNITARLEYRYTDYDKQKFNLNGSQYKRGFEENTVKVGLGFKF